MKAHDNFEKIVSTAEILFSRKGFRASGIKDILNASEVSRGTFYHYFTSKDELLVSLLTLYFQRLIGVMDIITSKPASGKDRLRYFFDLWHSEGQPEFFFRTSLYAMLASEVSVLDEMIRKNFAEGTCTIISGLTVLVNQGKRDGSVISLIDGEIIAREVFNMWLGASVSARLNNSASVFSSTIYLTEAILSGRAY